MREDRGGLLPKTTDTLGQILRRPVALDECQGMPVGIEHHDGRGRSGRGDVYHGDPFRGQVRGQRLEVRRRERQESEAFVLARLGDPGST